LQQIRGHSFIYMDFVDRCKVAVDHHMLVVLDNLGLDFEADSTVDRLLEDSMVVVEVDNMLEHHLDNIAVVEEMDRKRHSFV